jgi:RNA polymerase sigma factor (sigma-70 family)
MDKHNQKTDGQLLKLIQQNDESAIAVLLHRYKSSFYTTALGLVKDQYVAEDIFQDACIKIITAIRNGKYNESGKFVPWAMRILRNLAMDYLRIAKRMPRITLPDGNDIFSFLDFQEPQQFSGLQKEERYQSLYSLIQHLPDDQREILVLRIFANLSFNEITVMTGLKLNTAVGKMRYAITTLRKLRKKYGVLEA